MKKRYVATFDIRKKTSGSKRKSTKKQASFRGPHKTTSSGGGWFITMRTSLGSLTGSRHRKSRDVFHLTTGSISITLLTYTSAIDGGTMSTVTISPKFQVVIPKEIRKRLGLTPGQKIQTIVFEDRIELIPIKPIKKMKGFLKGIDTRVPREADRV